MPNGDVNQLGKLAAVQEPGTMAPADQAAMSGTPTATAPAPSGAGPGQPTPGAGAPGPEDKIAGLFTELSDIAQEMTQVDPRLTMLVKDTVTKLYVDISKVFGVEEEAKLAMKKGQGQMQAQGREQVTSM